jgi:hypothetical protein
VKAKQFFFGASHPAGVKPRAERVVVDDQLMQQLKARAAKLPIEAELASFARRVRVAQFRAADNG